MTTVHRVLPSAPYDTLADYLAEGGGKALEAARAIEPDVVIAELEASGLRGRGGAGFPTGTKWRTVYEHRSPAVATTVVVNAAEGEPGTFKDRTILRLNPYQVVEGALIAAHAVGASQVVVAMKASFTAEAERVRDAIQEATDAGWIPAPLDVTVHEGPDEYLYGEETALLESIAGRMPFPRIAPPYRRGVLEIVQTDNEATSESGLAAPIDMAGPTEDDVAPPTLVDNVETLANVPGIIARSAADFRSHGTDKSPGTIVCTITGSVKHPAVGEVPMGTSLRDAIDAIGGGPGHGRAIKAVLPGAANGFIPAEHLDTPLTYEAMQEIGSGLGSASFLVLDDEDDLAAVAAGVSRFLAVESCGQCTPCKQDGLTLAATLDRIVRHDFSDGDPDELVKRAGTIGDRARCYLALQHQAVISSLIERFPDEVSAHIDGTAEPTEPVLVTELVDLQDGKATLDERFRDKNPDWTYGDVDSGQAPADRFGDHRAATPAAAADAAT